MPVANRFSCLETDDVETDDGDDTLESQGPQCVRSYVSNIALDSHARDHDLHVVNGKVNGHQATMLIDCGSTHDFVSERFARKQYLVRVSDIVAYLSALFICLYNAHLAAHFIPILVSKLVY